MADTVDKTKPLELIDKYISPRYRDIDRLDHYVEGTQYLGRPNWWTAVETPLAEREPCVVYPIARIARDSFVDLVLGEHRFPSLKIAGTDAKSLRRTLRRARFEPVTREALGSGLGSRSACVVVGIRGGRPFLDTVPAKWCRPKFAPDQCTVASLEIEYPFIVEERDPQSGKWLAIAKVFRRVIDDKRDTTFISQLLTDALIQGKTAWTPDKERSVEHGLGYCPVVWWPFARGASIEGRFDGHAIHEHLLDEITALDLSLSQRQRAAFSSGDPQWTEIGVDKGYNPSGVGRQMRVPATPEGGPMATGPGARPPQHAYVDTGGDGSRKKGPANVWQYPNPETKVELHQLSAGALDAIDKNCRDLRLKICDALAYVPQDPDSIPTRGISGKALEALKEKQLARCDYIRDDVADGLLIPVLAMLCRVNNLRDAVDIEDVEIEWPPYYQPDAEDRSKELTAETTATSAASTFIKIPAFDKVAKKRLARLVLDGVSDEDLEMVEQAIDVQEQDGREAVDASDAVDTLGSPTLSKHVKTKAAMHMARGADDATKNLIKGEIASAPHEPTTTPSAPADDDEGGSPASPAAPTMPDAAGNGGTPAIAPDAHLRAASNAGVAETVYQLLREDYPKDAIDWIRSAQIEGPRLVPLEQIDFSNRANWNATDEQDRVDDFVQKISNGEMKPIVLVNEPNDDKLMIIDGHHRALAYEKLGEPAMAYVIHTGTVGGPWDDMHSSQNSLNGKLTSQQEN